MLFTKKLTISPQEAHEILSQNKDAILLDVRSSDEYMQIHIQGAKLLPLDEIAGRAQTVLPDKDGAVFVYCHSGMRAATAVKLLNRMGYTNVQSFGGIVDWPYETIRG